MFGEEGAFLKSISILIPIFNGKKYINGLITMFDKASQVLHKKYPEVMVKMIFVNDSPDDPLFEACFTNAENMTCEFLNPSIHQGIHGTRIYGLYHSISDFVLFFDQDDMVEIQYLLSQYENIELNGIRYDAVVCNGIYRHNRLIFNNTRPMEKTFDRKSLLEKQWNPLSPGQVLIRKKAIPIEKWSRYILKHNLTDDWLLWFLMADGCCRFNYNREVLYTHCENGTNSSLNWKEMGQSRIELLDVLRKLNVLSIEEDTAFEERTDKYLIKYEKYIKLDELLDVANHEQLVDGIKKKINGYRVSIYGMGVYGQMLLHLLLDAGVNVIYGIDQHAGAMRDSEIPVYGLNKKKYPETDIVIVTPLFAFDEIIRTTLKNINCPIVRVDDFIKDCLTIEKK